MALEEETNSTVADDTDDFDYDYDDSEDRDGDNLGDDETQAEDAIADDDEAAEPEGDEPEGEQAADPVIRLSDGTELPLSELEKSVMRDADYRKKTAEVAREREAAQTLRSEFEARARTVDATVQKLAAFLESAIPPEPPLALARQNPGEYQYQQAQRQMVIAELSGLVALRDEVNQEAEQARAAEMQRYRAENEAKLVKLMPELKDEARRAKFNEDVRKAALEFGFSEDEVANAVDARVLRMVHFARKGMIAEQNRKNATRRMEAPKRGTPAPAVTQPNGNRSAMARLAKTGSLKDALKVDFE